MSDVLPASDLMARWKSIHPADREAIMQALGSHQRAAFEDLLAEDESEAASRDSLAEFRAYSPRVARLAAACVEAAQSPGSAGDFVLTRRATLALSEAHAELRDSGERVVEQSLSGRLRAWLRAAGFTL